MNHVRFHGFMEYQHCSHLNLVVPMLFFNISCTSLKKGALGINNLVDFWNFLISHKACVPGQNCLLLLGIFPIFGSICSSLFTPILGVLPFRFWEVIPFSKATNGSPIIACFLTVAFVVTILCNEKYLK